MTRKLRWMAVVVLLLAAASLLSVYGYGRFAERARGAPSQAIAADRIETPVDRAIAPLEQAHPGQAGLALLADNLDAFAVRALTARAAGRSLDAQYYIWKPDLSGNLMVHELLRAADRGVRVRLLLDDLSVHAKDSVLAALDRHPNAEVRMFNPSRTRGSDFMRGAEMLLRGFSLNRRMHNKAWIVDGRVAVVGGRNIGDEYFGTATASNFLDADLAVVGPPVAETARIFDAFWNSASAIPLVALVASDEPALERLREAGTLQYHLPEASPYSERMAKSRDLLALLRDRNALHWTRDAHVYSDPPEKALGAPRRDWLVDALLPMARAARREALVISPYFVPGENGSNLFLRLREQGVRVGVLTNSLAATDVAIVHGGYAPYRIPLLRGGVELYELKAHGQRTGSGRGLLDSSSSDASLHTKAFMVDGEQGFVGSFNLDPRSINLNTEMGILFKDRQLTGELRRLYEWKIGGESSYRVRLQDGELRWDDASTSPPRTWTREPDASWGRRATAKITGWLPLESQL